MAELDKVFERVSVGRKTIFRGEICGCWEGWSYEVETIKGVFEFDHDKISAVGNKHFPRVEIRAFRLVRDGGEKIGPYLILVDVGSKKWQMLFPRA